MANFDFNPFAEEVILHVRCPKCDTVHDLYVSLPSADLSAETHRESINSDIFEIECPNCDFTFKVIVANGICGGDGEISNIEDDKLLGYEDVFSDEDWEDIPDNIYAGYVDPHVKEIRVALDKLDNLDEVTCSLLYRNLYANVISCLEAYLNDTAIQRIMSNPSFKRKFVETSIKFQDTQFKLSNIYNVSEKLDKLIMERLREIIYHKLEVVKPMYECTFNVVVGDISDLKRAIAIRHDIVHRNGQDKEGNLNEITKNMVIELISKVSDFIQNIESQFYQIDHPEKFHTEEGLNDLFSN